MLTDIDRKVLRILWNFWNASKRLPTLAELSRKTGRQQRGFPAILNRLQEERYIQWDGVHTSSIKILRG